MIEVKKLRKAFGSFVAVDDISFSVAQGEVLGFLGPNGAGKSTTMKMITGFLSPTQGTAVVCGHDICREPMAAKQVMGYLPEGAPAYGDMTPLQFLKFVAEIRGYRGAELMQRVNTAAEKINLGGVMHKPIDTLSKGFKRRVGLAQAILHDPRVLIMDEPTDGLDPNQKHEVRELIRAMAKDKAIVVSTHILEEVQAVCSRAIIVAQGKLLFDGTPDALATQSALHNAVTMNIGGAASDGIRRDLGGLLNVERVECYEAANGYHRVTVYPKGAQSIVKDVGAMARDKGWLVEELHVEKGRLDEVFRHITTDTQRVERGALT